MSHQSKELMRTGLFLGIAVVSTGMAWYVHKATQPKEFNAFAKVGEEFFPDFDDPTAAGSLKITDYDRDAKAVRSFEVEYKRGRWRIPSHHDYPADAKDELKTAAASLIGIKRKSLAGQDAKSHERFGVVEPPSEDAAETEDGEPLDGIGQRITVTDKNGNLLADYILGKRVEDKPGLYFMRVPDEVETYYAEVDLDVSTNFDDWVEKDLLKLERSELKSIALTVPLFREIPGLGRVPDGEKTVKVERLETSDPWVVEGMDAATEDINFEGVDLVQNTLDSLELQNVKPKLPGLSANLVIDPKKIDKLEPQLRSLGFMLVPELTQGDTRKFALFGMGGELIATTTEGLEYHLHFGRASAADANKIEVGKTDVATEEGEKVEASEPDEDTKEAGDENSDRYLFVRVEFHEELLGKKPEKPTEPQKPEGLKTADAKPAGDKPDGDEIETPEEIKQRQLQSEYNAKLAAYQAELATYEEDLKEFDKRREEGEKKAEELNLRFEDWFYVISPASYEKLLFDRKSLLKPKPKTSDEPGDDKPEVSELDKFLNGETPPKKTAPATAEKPPAKAE